MSHLMAASMPSQSSPASRRDVERAGQAGSSTAAAAAAAALSPWTKEHPTAEEMTLYTTLSAYADALDALPLDLTRSFSDLRELDAVLGPHLNSLMQRLNQLTAIIESPTFKSGERLLALKEVAEEARAYKMGGEDKIRVALNTAETIISHTTYIDTLLANLGSVPSLASILSPPSKSHLAGHLSDGTALAPGSGPGGNNPAIVESYQDSPSPVKKKRSGPAQSSSSSQAAGATGKQTSGQATGTTGNASAAKKRKSAGNSQVKPGSRGRVSQADQDHDAVPVKKSTVKRAKTNGAPSATPASQHADRGFDTGNVMTGTAGSEIMASQGSASRSRAAKTRVSVRESGSDVDEDGSDDDDAAAAASSRPARVARAPRPSQPSASGDEAGAPPVGGGAGDDADERRYCFCNNVSYGDMIGCDGDDCEREWFHLGCVGLLKPPQGTWYCDDCAAKRTSRGGGLGKRPKGGAGGTVKVAAKTSGAHGGGVVMETTKSRSVSAKR